MREAIVQSGNKSPETICRSQGPGDAPQGSSFTESNANISRTPDWGQVGQVSAEFDLNTCVGDESSSKGGQETGSKIVGLPGPYFNCINIVGVAHTAPSPPWPPMRMQAGWTELRRLRKRAYRRRRLELPAASPPRVVVPGSGSKDDVHPGTRETSAAGSKVHEDGKVDVEDDGVHYEVFPDLEEAAVHDV